MTILSMPVLFGGSEAEMLRTAAAVALLVALALSANASLISWGAAPTVPDPDDAFQYSLPLVALGNGQDIYTGVWWDDQGGYRYFRMDLQGTPTGPNDYAEIYGIYIDAIPGGSDGPTDPLDYIPDQLTGIDYILDMHFSANFGWWDQHFHTWTGTSWTTATADQYQRSNSDKQLEWGQDITDFLGGGTFWGGTHSAGGFGNPDVTHDLTESGSIPEPGTMALFGLGLLGAGLYLKRRRR